ncbi:MAG: transposase [Bacteroidales bacterium]|nr:transposase [Bacteroidales bacterium]
MSTAYKIIEQDKLHFLTLRVINWIDIFTNKTYKDIIIDNLKYCQKEKGLEIYAYVIMSNHIHLLARASGENLSDVLRDFKSYSSKVILKTVQETTESRKKWILNQFAFAAKKHSRNTNYQLWTHENHAELIYSNKFIEQKLNYIHNNPVKKGIVEMPEDYLYSSARNYAGKDSHIDIELLTIPVKTVR